MNHASNIVHETLEGETIVIHLETGSYYSLTGSGAEIWELLSTGPSVAEICTALGRRYGQHETEIRAQIESFIADLEGEGLIEAGTASTNGAPTSTNGVPAPAAEPGQPWEPPKLERYDDMRDFLLVDPIHEVDQTGWPHPKPAP